MNRDDVDERQARIDMLIDEVRTKYEKTRELAKRAREKTHRTSPHAAAKIERVRARHHSRKKAG